MSGNSAQHADGQVTSPVECQVIECGADLMIAWQYNESANQPCTVDIELRNASTNEPLQTIVTNVSNFGYYFWNVDRRLLPSNNVMLFIGKVLSPTSCAQIYSDRFSIAKKPQQSLLSGAYRHPATHGYAQTNSHSVRSNEPPTWSVSGESLNSTFSRTAARDAVTDTLETSFSQMSLDETVNSGSGGGGGSGGGAGNNADSYSIDEESEDSLQMARRKQARKTLVRGGGAAEAQQQSGSNVAAHGNANGAGCFSNNTGSRGGRPRGRQSGGSHSQSTSVRSSTNNIIDDPVIWSAHPDFIYWAVYMDATTIRRCLRQVVKTEGMQARAKLDNGHSAGMFCVRYLLLLYYKEKIPSDVRRAIESGIYIPHPTLLATWHSSAMYRQQCAATLGEQTQSVQTSSSTPNKRREQVRHADIVNVVPRRVTRSISSIRPSTRSTLQAAANPSHQLRQPSIKSRRT